MTAPSLRLIPFVVAASALAVGACSAAAPHDGGAPPGPTYAAPTVMPSDAPPSDSAEPAGSGAPVASASASSKPPEGPSACPTGMVLVDGEYCDGEVEHNCVKEWYADQNKKYVCEDFEPNKATCKGTKVKKRYCIDKFEWPNKAGERPEVMNRFHQAQVKCAAVGKRMCAESEWNFACEGPDMKPFPNGYHRDPTVCNGDQLWDEPNMKLVEKRDATELGRLWKGMRSGSQPGCVSDFGVYDMPGNADEVVASEQNPNGKRGKFDSIHTGGPWYSGVRNQCRPKVYTHGEDFYYYFLSFRCCAEADGKPTDPRTPRQVKEGWQMKKVERLAQFSVDEMKEKLRLKGEGKCECKDTDVLCKTMCGTLLGPNATDTSPSVPRARYAGKRIKGQMKD